MLHEVKISENENIRIGGRTISQKDPVILQWGGSFIELTVKASELWIEVAGPHTNNENWMAVEINGAILSRQIVPKEKSLVPVFIHRNPEKETRVRIFKEVQAMSGDAHHALEIYGVKLDGEIVPSKEYSYKLEFIGDSITSSEGTMGAKEEEDWISMYFSHTHAYSYMTGKALNAEVRCISQSGWGVFASWDSHFDCNLPAHYEEICSLCNGEEFAEFQKPYDFSSWQPDAVIINLGTNDASAFHQEGYFNEATGKLEELRMEGDKFNAEDADKVSSYIAEFLKKVRKNNPGAYILWAYGMLSTEFEEVILAGIQKYKETSQDDRIKYLVLPEVNDDTVGARWHPGEKCHRAAAEVLVKELKEIL
ncbi:MAG: GDSL-type esterase/lipase family protein [Lachnospiraceae bacterium]|nr:GDSL-type esterase/lipase family protein [Lachnospiraceae bacterium]